MGKNKSFTIIELLIVITVISIISGLTLAYYNNQSDTYKLKAQANKIIDIFDLTRKRAITSEKPENCHLNNYSITFNTVAKTYTVTRSISNTDLNPLCCSDGATCDDFTKEYSIDNTLTITTSTNQLQITPLNGIVNPDNIMITLRKSVGKCYDILFFSSAPATTTANTTCL